MCVCVRGPYFPMRARRPRGYSYAPYGRRGFSAGRAVGGGDGCGFGWLVVGIVAFGVVVFFSFFDCLE